MDEQLLKHRAAIINAPGASVPLYYGDGSGETPAAQPPVISAPEQVNQVVTSIDAELRYIEQASGISEDAVRQYMTGLPKPNSVKDLPVGPDGKVVGGLLNDNPIIPSKVPLADPTQNAYRERMASLIGLRDKVQNTPNLATIKNDIISVASDKSWNANTDAKNYTDQVSASVNNLAFIQGTYEPSLDNLINQRNIALYTVLHGDTSSNYDVSKLEKLTDMRTFGWWRDEMRQKHGDDKELMQALNDNPDDSSKWPDRVKTMYVNAMNQADNGQGSELAQLYNRIKNGNLGRLSDKENQMLAAMDGAYVVENEYGQYLVKRNDPQYNDVDAKRFQEQKLNGGNGYYNPPTWVNVLKWIGLGIGIVALAATGVGAVVDAVAGAGIAGAAVAGTEAAVAGAEVAAAGGIDAAIEAGAIGAEVFFDASETFAVTAEAFPTLAENAFNLEAVAEALAVSPSQGLAEAATMLDNGLMSASEYINFVDMVSAEVIYPGSAEALTGALATPIEAAATSTGSVLANTARSLLGVVTESVVKAVPEAIAGAAISYGIEKAFDVHPVLGTLLKHAVAESALRADGTIAGPTMQGFASEMLQFSGEDTSAMADFVQRSTYNLLKTNTPLGNQVSKMLASAMSLAIQQNESSYTGDLTTAQLAELAYRKNPPSVVRSRGTTFERVYHDGQVNAYLDRRDKEIVVAVRGTRITDLKDLQADASIPINKLAASKRYIADKQALQKLISKYDPNTYDFVLTGHSLGGAIVSQLMRDFPFLQKASVYNAAVQPEDILKGNKKVKRHYASDDPLYKLGGFLTEHTIKRHKGERSLLEAHSISQFNY